jgi:hypothetical protein
MYVVVNEVDVALGTEVVKLGETHQLCDFYFDQVTDPRKEHGYLYTELLSHHFFTSKEFLMIRGNHHCESASHYYFYSYYYSLDSLLLYPFSFYFFEEHT